MTPVEGALKGLSSRQAAFARHYVEGNSMLDCYAKAGYASRGKAAEANAIHTRKVPKVAKAIVALQGIANNKSVITRETLAAHLFDHREAAIQSGQIGAANQAVMGVAKLMGLEVNKSEVAHTHSYEVEQATQELFNMLSRRGKAPALPDPEVIDAEVIDDA